MLTWRCLFQWGDGASHLLAPTTSQYTGNLYPGRRISIKQAIDFCFVRGILAPKIRWPLASSQLIYSWPFSLWPPLHLWPCISPTSPHRRRLFQSAPAARSPAIFAWPSAIASARLLYSWPSQQLSSSRFKAWTLGLRSSLSFASRCAAAPRDREFLCSELGKGNEYIL